MARPGTFKLLNPLKRSLEPGADLMGLIHTDFDAEEKLGSDSFHAGTLHFTGTDPYKYDSLSSLYETKLKNWPFNRFRNDRGLLVDMGRPYSKSKPITVAEFKKLAGPDLKLGHDFSELYSLWDRVLTEEIPYIQNLENVQHKDNRVKLTEFENPLRLLCREKKLNLIGMDKAYTLVGLPGTTSPTHKEDRIFGSANELIIGKALWVIVDMRDNKKLAKMLANHLKINCENLLASKQYILTPQLLDKWKIRYYLILQNPGDIVVTMPGSIHLVTNLEFSVKLAVNYIPTRWLEPLLDHVDCFCPLERKIPKDIGAARCLQHGQSLAQIIPNSMVLRACAEYKTQRRRAGLPIRGMIDEFEMEISMPTKKAKFSDAKDFGRDLSSFKKANTSQKKYFCKLCFEDKLMSEEKAQMSKTKFNRHVAAYHVITKSTRFCKTCPRRFGDEKGFKTHTC